MNPKEIIGDIELANPPTSEPPIRDSLDRARHVWTKGRFESMGGYAVYTQGHGIDGYENQNRVPGYTPENSTRDSIAKELGMDNQE